MVPYKLFAEIKVPVEKAGIEAWNIVKDTLEINGITVDRIVLEPIKEE